MKLLVTGGNGFIGQQVCRLAAAAGDEVVALGRRGRPAGAEGWADAVRWVRGSVLEPEGWRAELAGCGAVVHCVGIIRQAPRRGVTFERLNGDAAIVAAGEAARAGVEAFVFLSASAKPPLLDEAYLSAKRRAEAEIARLPIRSAVLRPGFVYGRGRLPSLPAALLLRAAAHLPLVGATARGSRPLPVETVARAALAAARRWEVRGVLEVDGLERLGASVR